MTEQGYRDEIKKFKEQYSDLLEDAAKLEKAKEEAESIAQKLKDRRVTIEKRIAKQEQERNDEQRKWEENVNAIWNEKGQLEKRRQEIIDQIDQVVKDTEKLDVISASGIERKMAFKGKLGEKVSENGMCVKHRILYPLAGGTALITFEKPGVALKVIGKKYHQVEIEECRINVKAEPVELMILDVLSVDTTISSHKILVSNLPPSVPEDKLLDKLELFFCKSRNRGGEVESREFLFDTKTATITFVGEGVAARLTETTFFHVPFEDSMCKVQVTPSLNGHVKNRQMKTVACKPDSPDHRRPYIADPRNLRELLEIYIQSRATEGERSKPWICPGGKHLGRLEDDVD
ncbi:hypothetical protein FKM82_019638 [Ascaphus truei]